MERVGGYDGAAGAMCAALSGGDHVGKLTDALDMYFGRACVPMCSADAALHTALRLCGAGVGEYVFFPSYTFYPYVATAVSMGVLPVFIDSDPTTRCMSASALDGAFVWAELQGKLPRAVVIDNAFGAVARFDELTPLCKSRSVPVIELACDALGGDHAGVPCGGNGDYGIVSLCKRVPGGGGALVCGDERERARCFSRMRYAPGGNRDYRLHNVLAALDCALFPALGSRTSRARDNYAKLAAKSDLVLSPTPGDAAMYAPVRVPAGRLRAISGLTVKRVPPVHTLPEYANAPFFEHEPGFCACASLAENALVGMDISALTRLKLSRALDMNV